MTTTPDDLDAFALAYGCLHIAAELAEKMAAPDGKPRELNSVEVATLQRLCREAACAANEIGGTIGGQRKTKTS
jgi:hypothetical protein